MPINSALPVKEWLAPAWAGFSPHTQHKEMFGKGTLELLGNDAGGGTVQPVGCNMLSVLCDVFHYVC